MKASRYIVIRKQKRNAENKRKPYAFLRGAGLVFLALTLFTLTGLGIYYAVISQSFPSLELFRDRYSVRPEPTRFYGRDGQTLLFTLAYENFQSRDLQICNEDGEGCFPHTFLEAARITRSEGVRRGQLRPVTEDMVREVYAETIEGSRFPGLMTWLLSHQVMRTFGEEQILTWHYNSAWFGQMAFGLDEAARLYLDKSGDELSDAESVLLSAIIHSPMLNPIDSHGALRDSYLDQIRLLHQAGLFSDDEAENLSHSNFTIFEPPQYIGGAVPDIITRKALDAAFHLYGREQVERGGLRVITSEDTALQDYLFCVTSPAADDEETSLCPLSPAYTEDEQKNAREALAADPVSIAILDVNNGQLLAALEAQSDNENKRIYLPIQQAYPIGSVMNLFAALTAFSGGSSPSTLLWDLPESYESGVPADEEEAFHGPVHLEEALTKDYRRPLSAHLQSFGSGAVQRNAALFGLNSSRTLSDSSSLSENESYTAEAAAFSLIPFATLGDQTGTSSGGSMHTVSILRVERDNGETDVPQPSSRKALIADNLAWLVHHVFSQSGESFSLSDRPSAVKIGKVPGENSRMISGYTTQLSCSLRVGNQKTVSAFVMDTDEIQGPAEILWRSVMEYAHRSLPASGWEVPEGISRVRICMPSGKLPTPACRETITGVFLQGNEPYEYDDYYVEVPINRENRMLATRYTPAEDVQTEIFLNYPENASAWAAENGIEQMPTEYDPIRNDPPQSAVLIESPAEFQSFSAESSDKIDIIVRLSFRQQPESVQVSIGSGMYPTQWTEVCSGKSLENGQWLLCSLNSSSLEPGLYSLRTAFTLPDRAYRSAETYFTVE